MSTAAAALKSKRQSLPFDRELLFQQLARRRHLRFIQYCWMDQNKPFHIGFHTRRICDRIDRAINDFRENKSTYLAIAVHHRSGKSEIVSGNLAPHFLGEFPGSEVMNVTYQANLAQRWGRKARSLFESPQFHELYPNVRLSQDSKAANRWEIQLSGRSTHGGFSASGLSSGITGTGAHLAILDDYLAGRKAAESPVMRENAWNSFTNEFMTRLSPVHIVVVLATWWHFDDIRGRIMNRMDPTHDDYDPTFPGFEFLDFPARAEDWEERRSEGEEESYPGDYLFDHVYDEARQEWLLSPQDWFGAEWYETQYATLGPYSAAGIMDCNPRPREGRVFNTENVVVHPTPEEFPKSLKWMRVWDYAHSSDQRAGSDPDYTGGTLFSMKRVGYNVELSQPLYEIWVKDYTEFRLQAPARDARIVDVTRRDGALVRVVVEGSLDSIDGARYLKERLKSLRSVAIVRPRGDKLTRATPVEPIFEAGNVHIVRAAWNAIWLRRLDEFDGTGKTHDEPVDNLTCGYEYTTKHAGYGPMTVRET